MSIQEVIVSHRPKLGKEESGRMRRSGMVPSVVYGLGEASSPIAVAPKAIDSVLHSEKGFNSVLLLRVGSSDETRHVMIKSVDRHPVTERLMHVDFMRIDMDKKITATVPVQIVGVPTGAKLGGVLNVVRHELEVECLPKDMPAAVVADVSNLGLDETFRLGDLQKPEGVVFKLEDRRVIAVVHAPDAQIPSDDDEDEDAK